MRKEYKYTRKVIPNRGCIGSLVTAVFETYNKNHIFIYIKIRTRSTITNPTV
jgi:hypothetical protein